MYATLRGIVSRMLPQLGFDQLEMPLRLGRYQEAAVLPILNTLHPLADEGTYFTTQGAALGTTTQLGVDATFSDTGALAVIFNNDNPSAPQAKTIYLHRAALMFTTAPASATGTRCAVKIDTGNRAPTANATQVAGQGGTIGAQQVGPQTGTSGSIAKIWLPTTGGAALLTVPASVNARVVASGGIDGIPVIGGERGFSFGTDRPSTGQHCALPPVAIAPGQYAVFHVWFPGNAATGPQAELALDWFER